MPPTIIRKTIAQKKATTASAKKSARKSMKQRHLLNNRTRLKGEPAARICCRCELRIKADETVLGGSYNGVVCLNHRSCISCWFDKTPIRAARRHEAAKTKNIGLVDKPFVKPLCPGCKKGLPPFEVIKPAQFYEKDDVIHFFDSDEDE